jgi:hypothetical protein
MTHRSEPDALADHDCREWSEQCDGEVQWQDDGAKRCVRHQLLFERDRRKQRLLAWTVAALVVVGLGIVANALTQPDEGPSQTRAWEVCEDYVVENLDLPAGPGFAELPANPSERVKIQLGSNRYDVFSYYQSSDVDRTDFRCTVAYLGGGDWEVLRLVTAPG